MKWMLCIGVVAMLVGCDASKDELESTKTTLASVTKERDNLKTQLDAAKADLAKTKASSPTAATAAKTTPTANAKSGPATTGKSKDGHKS